MLTLQHNITADFLANFLDDFDVEIKGERSFKKRLPDGTLFVQKWRDTAEWCVSLYGTDDRQSQVFISTVSEFWDALKLFHVKQYIAEVTD